MNCSMHQNVHTFKLHNNNDNYVYDFIIDFKWASWTSNDSGTLQRMWSILVNNTLHNSNLKVYSVFFLSAKHLIFTAFRYWIEKDCLWLISVLINWCIFKTGNRIRFAPMILSYPLFLQSNIENYFQ